METATRHRSQVIRDTDVVPVCPAGERVAGTVDGPGIRCRIEHSLILASTSPGSIQQFCCSDGYRRCTTWLAEKARIEAARKTPLIEE